MIHQNRDINLGKFVFDDNTQKESRSPIWDKQVLDLYLCFCPNFCHFVEYLWFLLEKNPSVTGEESTVWVGIFWGEFGIIPTSRSPRSSQFLQKIVSSYRWLIHPRRESHSLSTIGSKFKPFHPNLTKFTCFINVCSHSTILCRKHWKYQVCSRCTLWIYRFVKKQRSKVPFNLRRVSWKIL